jgi:hemolysin activation/secretion protein
MAGRAETAQGTSSSNGGGHARAGGLPRFDLWELDVVGNSVLDQALVQDTLAPFLGRDKTLEDVDKARATLESLYNTKGFKTVSVAIPKQKVKDGIVLLQVTEGRVRLLTVVGSKYHSIDRIKKSMSAVAEGTVPNWEQMRKNLIALDQQADLTVTPSLKAGTAPATVDMDLVADDKLPLHGMVELNNRYNQGTVHNRLIGNLSYNNLWQAGHSLSLTYETAPQRPENAHIVFGNYLATFGDSPFSLLLSGLHTTSNVTTLGSITVLGAGRSYGAQGIWKLPDGDNVYSSVSAGITYKDFKADVQFGGNDSVTPITYYPISLGYSRYARTDTSNTQFDASMNFTTSRQGSDSATIDANRFGARNQMFYVRSSLAWTQDLPAQFQTYLHVTGQITDQPLISNEQLSAGGMDTVRGYLEAETLGDQGIESSFEFRGPSLPGIVKNARFDRNVQDLRPFVFVDQAYLAMHGPFPNGNETTGSHLLSTGAGLNLNLFDFAHGALDWGHALVAGPNTRAGMNRVTFRVWATF